MGQDCDVPSSDMSDETFTVTLMTTLDPKFPLSFALDIRVDNNTVELLEVCLCILEDGDLSGGDILIMDTMVVPLFQSF